MGQNHDPWQLIRLVCVPDILWTVVGFYFLSDNRIISHPLHVALEDMFGKVPGFNVVYS